MSAATLAIRLTLEGAGMAGRAVGAFAGAISRLPGAISAANQNLFFFLGNLRSIEGFVAKLGKTAFEHLVIPNIKADQQIEALTFMTGSAEQARAKLHELFDAAGRADLPHEDIVKMYLALQRLGGAALASDQTLELIGKAAKFAGVSGAEMAQQLAEAYTVLQAGKAFDRSSLGLAKAGVVSPETVKQLADMSEKLGAVHDAQKKVTEARAAEEMAKQSGRFSEWKQAATAARDAQRDLKLAQQQAQGLSTGGMWSMLTKDMGRITAKVKEAAPTWTDLSTRVRDFVEETKKITGAALFEAMKADLTKLRDDLQKAFDEGKIQKWATIAGKAIADLYEGIKQGSLFGLTAEDLINAAEQGKLKDLLGTAIGDSAKNFGILLLNSATEYGPRILQAILGKDSRLAGLLGVDDAVLKQKMAAGQGSIHDYEKLGWSASGDLLGRMGESAGAPSWLANSFIGKLGAGAYFGTRSPEEQRLLMQQYAGSGAGGARSYIDVRQDLAGRGLLAPTGAMADRERLLKLFGGSGYNVPAGALQSSGGYLAALQQAAQKFSTNNPVPADRPAELAMIRSEVDRLKSSLGDAADEATRLVEALGRGAAF